MKYEELIERARFYHNTDAFTAVVHLVSFFVDEYRKDNDLAGHERVLKNQGAIEGLTRLERALTDEPVEAEDGGNYTG